MGGVVPNDGTGLMLKAYQRPFSSWGNQGKVDSVDLERRCGKAQLYGVVGVQSSPNSISVLKPPFLPPQEEVVQHLSAYTPPVMGTSLLMVVEAGAYCVPLAFKGPTCTSG